MTEPPTRTFLTLLPKCEHHIHIEGALSANTLFALAMRNQVKLPSPKEDPAYASPATLAERYKSFSSLDDFLGYYYKAMSVLLHQSDFYDLCWSYLTKARADGVRHAEIFFDPQAHLSRGVSFTTVINGLSEACRKAEEQLGLTTALICCFLRHLPATEALDLIKTEDFQQAARARKFAAIGLDSSEVGFPPVLFRDVYAEATRLGLKLTAHAGEEGPASNIKDSLDILGCQRIDHGIRLADDENLMKTVAAQGTMLTVCPLSNKYLRCVDDVKELPVRKFIENGVKFSINSDDPCYLGGFILDNYVAVQEAFSLSRTEWQQICQNAIEGSWCDDGRKADLNDMLQATVQMDTEFEKSLNLE